MGPLAQETTQAQALEFFRRRAEADTAGRSMTRRPSWSLVLTISGELEQICRVTGLFEANALPLLKLWACFVAPQPGEPHICGGFELCAGKERARPGHPENQLWQASRSPSGKWHCSALDAYRLWPWLKYYDAGLIEPYDDNLQDAAARFCLRVRAHELGGELVRSAFADFINGSA